MSFSYRAKEELCRDSMGKKNAVIAECLGIALFCHTFRSDCLRIVTGNEAFVLRLPKLFRKAFGISMEPIAGTMGGKPKSIFEITDPEELAVIYDAFGFNPGGERAIHLNYNIIEDSACAHAFLRGAFLAGGSVTDPVKRYHLELVTTHRTACMETFSLMLDLELSPKDTVRNGNYVLYFKQSEAISDFLTIAGAAVCAMEVIEAKVEKEISNGINRFVNCETANLYKVVDAAQEQLSAIRTLRKSGRFSSLPDKLRSTAELREEYPEATLSELAELFDPPITKSAVNHRMRKLIELAK